ncbi:MAG TPA: AAA family ATPase [Acetobacteraceae bacterium]|jgi:predicted ATPase|nr:AAA family ATPase [Acetobacteraceae bacterium]
MDQFVVISGCSGSGKSTLLSELKGRGCAVVEEPGRRIIAEASAGDEAILPWVNPEAFARRAIELSLDDRNGARNAAGWVFFDRGLIDAAAALQYVTGQPALTGYGLSQSYNRHVFMIPPWPEIYRKDEQRRHNLDDAIAEYRRLLKAFSELKYEPIILPKVDVHQRADVILERLKLA